MVPLAALRLAESARELSWDVRVQGSLGYVPHASTGRPGAVKESIGLRFGNHPMTDRQAYAMYRRSPGGTWSWVNFLIWGPELVPYAGCSLADLNTYLSEPAMPSFAVNAWVARLKKQASETEAARKARTRVRAAIVKKANDGRFEAARQESRADWYRVDAEWRSKVADLADGVFTSEEVAKMIEPKVTGARDMR